MFLISTIFLSTNKDYSSMINMHSSTNEITQCMQFSKYNLQQTNYCQNMDANTCSYICSLVYMHTNYQNNFTSNIKYTNLINFSLNHIPNPKHKTLFRHPILIIS
jgi:hypothetical protein